MRNVLVSICKAFYTCAKIKNQESKLGYCACAESVLASKVDIDVHIKYWGLLYDPDLGHKMLDISLKSSQISTRFNPKCAGGQDISVH
jgi:hypothetical protein